MRGVQDNIQVNDRLNLGFNQIFNDVLTKNNVPEPPKLDIPEAGVEASLADRWHSDGLNEFLTHYFLDDVPVNHPIVSDFIDAFIDDEVIVGDAKQRLVNLHNKLQTLFKQSTLHARTLVHFELAVLKQFFTDKQQPLPDIHAYDAKNMFNNVEFGIVWPTAAGWECLGLFESSIQPFDVDAYSLVELNGDCSRILYPNGRRLPQSIQVIDANHTRVIKTVNELFTDGFSGESVASIVDTIHNHMQTYDYIQDVKHEWQTLTTIFNNNGGDCEDLAHLEASLLARAFADAGMLDAQSQINLVAGFLGQGATKIGHTVIELTLNNKTYILDSTAKDGLVLKSIYASFYNFVDGIRYKAINSDEINLQAAKAIDTEANTSAASAEEVISWVEANYGTSAANWQEFEEDFLAELGLIEYETDAFGNKTQTQLSNYKESALAYYDAVKYGIADSGSSSATVTDAFVKATSDPVDLANASLEGTEASYEVIDQDLITVGNNTFLFDFETGLEGSIEQVYNRSQEMSYNLTSELMNKYIGQTYNGFYIYDYSRVMADYQDLVNSIQLTTCYITSVMAYSNAFNWIGSQLSGDNQPNPEIKNRQKFIKSVQNSLLKMVDEVDYFISMFTQTYDDLNTATYSTYQQDINGQYQNLNSGIRDVFTLGEETIEKNQLLEKLELEYWYVNAKNREMVMQASYDMPNSQVLASFVNFSQPFSDIMSSDVGGPKNFAGLANSMEADIEAGVFMPIQVSVSGSVPQTAYISAKHYYFAYYFQGDTIDLYSTALGDTSTLFSAMPNMTLTNENLYTILQPQYDALGLSAMDASVGGFGSSGYTLPNWVSNVVGGDYVTYGNGGSSPVDDTNYKSTNLYKYFHASGMKYLEQFENEQYNEGFSTSPYNISGSESGTWKDNLPSSLIEFGDVKKRFHPLDFADILDFDLDTINDDSYTYTPSVTSQRFWEALEDKGYIDQYGKYQKSFALKMIEGNASGIIADLDLDGIITDSATRTALGERMYNMFRIDEYQYGKTEYDYTRPQLYARATKALRINRYIDPFNNTGSNYQFLNDWFSDGPSADFLDVIAESSNSASEEAAAQADASPDFTIANRTIVDWSQLSDVEITKNSNTLMASPSVIAAALADKEAGDYIATSERGTSFYDDLVLDDVASADQYVGGGNSGEIWVASNESYQEAFYDRLSAVSDEGDVPQGYIESAGMSYTGYGASWELVDFNDLPIGSDQLNSDYESIINDENAQLTASPTYPTLTDVADDLAASAPIIVPSASTDYSYDFGLMNKLPFDDRIVSESTQSTYANQGPKILGEIEYVDVSATGLDYSNTDNIETIKTYEGLFSNQTTAVRDELRSNNSLEKELTPVHSYNDQSVVFSTTQLKGYIGWTGTEDDFIEFMTRMDDEDLVEPVFRRIDSDFSNSASAEDLGLYALMGYTFKSSFIGTTDFDLLGGFGAYSTEDISNYAAAMQSGVITDYIDAWREGSYNEMMEFMYTGTDHTDAGFLSNKDNQLLRWVGQPTDGPILGLEEAMPFMSYDWHALKAAHNGMTSIQNRIRLFYFISQAYISSYQNITKKLDEVAFSGTSAIEADAQIFEKRVGKQVELLAQINAKTAQFTEVNNQYYKQKTASITASDIGVRIAKGVKLYGDLSAAVLYLASVVAHAIAKANTGAPWYPVAYAVAEGLKLTSTGLQIAAMVGEVTEKSIYVAHQYGIPRMMEEDLYAENLNDTSTAKALENFKKMTYYKSPITLENGDKWEEYNGTYEKDGSTIDDTSYGVVTGEDYLDSLKNIYSYYSPVAGTGDFTYKSEGLMRDEWQTAQVTADSQSGDCEDYAILAASRALGLGIDEGDLRIVNGLVGYGGPDPKSHTVLLYKDTTTNGDFATQDNAAGKKEFTDSDDIYVIDLGTEYNPTTSTFYTLEEYQNEFGYFQPTYSYDSPGADVNLNYGFKDFEIFGYTPSAMLWPDSHGEPKGPQDLVASDGTYTYYFDQNSSRKLIIDIYGDGGSTFIEQREVSGKIEYGVEEYSITDPDGQLQVLRLDNAAAGIGSSEVNEDSLNNAVMAESGDSSITLPTVELDFGSSTEADIEWETEGVFESISGGGGSAGIGSQIVTNQMQELLTLEMEEHAILTEMFNLSMDPLNMHTDDSIKFNVYDWPAFQALQRRLFVVQTKMKKMFLVMKLRAEFFSLIGVRLGDIERQQMSSSMDSIFQSHFSQVSDSVEKLSQIMMSMQSISQSNYDVYDNRYKSVWELGFTTPMNIILGFTSALVPENGPAIVAAFQAFTGVLMKVATFFGNPYNAYNLKDNEAIRESSKMVGSDATIDQIVSLYGDSDYADWITNINIYEDNGKIPKSDGNLSNESNWSTQLETKDDGYSLTVDDVEQHYWDDIGGYNSPSFEDVYKGQMYGELNGAVGHYSAEEFQQQISLEDYMMQRMSSRFFEESGNELLFLNSSIYAMSGAKLFGDAEFFDWFQERLTAEMMRQVVFSMAIATYRSLTANLGYTGTGGNDAIQMSTSLTGDIGSHYFQLQNTLANWEQAQIEISNRRFQQYKYLDQLILEGILAVGSLMTFALGSAVSTMAKTGTTVLQTLGRVALQILSGVTLVMLQIVSQVTALIYNAIDANEENTLKKNLEKRTARSTGDASLLDRADEDLSSSELAQKQLMAEREKVGQETLKTAGNSSTGFASTYVDQSAKVKMKRKVQELFKVLEIQSTISESTSETFKNLASNLGYSTSQTNVSGALSTARGLSKQAEDKSVEEQFSLLQAAAARDNEIHAAAKAMIMSAATVVVTGILKGIMNNVKSSPGATSANSSGGGGMPNFGLAIIDNVIKGFIINMIKMGIMKDGAKELKKSQEEQEAENKEGKTKEVDSVGDAASSKPTQRLSGLEQRGLNAQYNVAGEQMVSKIDEVLSQIFDEMGKEWGEFIASASAALAKAIAGALSEAAGLSEDGGSDNAEIDAAMAEMTDPSLGGDSSGSSGASGTSPTAGTTPTASGGGTGSTTAGLDSTKNTPRDVTAAAAKKSADNADKKIAEAENLEKNTADNQIKRLEDSNDPLEAKDLSSKDIAKILKNPDIKPSLRVRLVGEQLLRASGIRLMMNSAKDLGKAKTVGGGAIAGLKLLSGLVMLATSPLLANVYQKAQEDLTKPSSSEIAKENGGVDKDSKSSSNAEKAMEIAVTAALVAENNNFLSGNTEQNEKRQEFLARNPKLVAKVLSKMANREKNQVIRSNITGGKLKFLEANKLNFSMSQEIMKMLVQKSVKGGKLHRLGAQVMANLPGSATANMENAMDAFTTTDKSGKKSTEIENVMKFLDQIKGFSNGPTVVKEMLNPVNETGIFNKLIARGKSDGRKAISDRMQELLTNPESASKIAVFQAEGLMDNTLRLNHLMQFTDTHLAKNLQLIKEQTERQQQSEKLMHSEDSKQKKLDMKKVAQSMANLYSAGAGVTGTVQGMSGPTYMTYHHTGSIFGGMDYLNSAERQGIVDVLKTIQSGGQAGKDDVKHGLEIALQGANDSRLQKEKIHELANKLGITLDGTISVVAKTVDSPSAPTVPTETMESRPLSPLLTGRLEDSAPSLPERNNGQPTPPQRRNAITPRMVGELSGLGGGGKSAAQPTPQRDFAGELEAAQGSISNSQQTIAGLQNERTGSAERQSAAELRKGTAETSLNTAETQFKASAGRQQDAGVERSNASKELGIQNERIDDLSKQLANLKPGSDADALVKAQNRLNNANASVEELEQSQQTLQGQNTTLSQELGKKKALIGSIESKIKTQQGKRKALIDLDPDKKGLDALNEKIAGFESDIRTHQLTIEKNPVTKDSIQDEFINRVIEELQHGKGDRGSLIKGKNVNDIRAALKEGGGLEKLLNRFRTSANKQDINNFLIGKLNQFVGTGNHAVKNLGYKIPTEDLGAENAMNQGLQDNANAAIQAIKYKLETAQNTKADIEKSIQKKQQENKRVEKLNNSIDTEIKRLSGDKKSATDDASDLQTQLNKNNTLQELNSNQLEGAREEQTAAQGNLSSIEKANEAADSQYSEAKNGLKKQLKAAQESREKALNRISAADSTIAIEDEKQKEASKAMISADAVIRQEDTVISEQKELQTSLDAQIDDETKKIEDEQRKIAGILAAQAAQEVAKNAVSAITTQAISNVTDKTPTDQVVVSASDGQNLDNQQSDPGKPKGPVRDFEGRQAALMLARIAEQEGLLTGEDLMKEQLLTINEGKIKIDEPDALVKRIIEAASATTDSAGNTGVVNSFLTDLGLKSEDPATISDVQNNPKLLFTVIKQKEENIVNFVSKLESGQLKTNLPDGTTLPESAETIKRLVQAAQRGAPLDVVTIPEKADSKAKIEENPNRVGNVSGKPDAGQINDAPDPDILTLSKGEETVRTDTQDLQNQQASANNDPETKSSNLDEMRSMLTKAGKAMKNLELSVRKAMGQSIPAEKVVGQLITDGEIAEMTNQGIIDDAKLIIDDSNKELADLEDKLNQTTTLELAELDKQIASLEQEISEGQHEYDQMKSGSDGGDGGAISTGSSSIQTKAVSSAGGAPQPLGNTLQDKAKALDAKKAKLDALRGQRDQTKIEGLSPEDRQKFEVATTAKANAEITVAEKTKENELLAQQLKDLKTTGARVAVDDMVDLINQKTDGGAKELSAEDVTTFANSMADLLAKGADDHVVMSALDLVSEGGKDAVFNMDIQITKRPIARALMQELVKLTANNKQNDPDQRVDKAISNFTSHSPSFKVDIASVAKQGQLLSGTLESAVTGGKSDPAKTSRIAESDKQLAEAMRTEINDVLNDIKLSGADPSSDQLKQVVNNMKALCRSGIEYYQKQLPSSDDVFTQDALNNIQVLKNSNMLIQEFQERDGSDVGAKIALINVLNQPGITDTIVFEGVGIPRPDSFTYDLNLESTPKPGRMAGLLGKKESKLTKEQIGQIKSSLRTIAEFTKLPEADVSSFKIQPAGGDNKQQILDFVNNHWDKLDVDQQVAIATHFNKDDNVGVLTDEIKSKFDTVIGDNLLGLVAGNLLTKSQLDAIPLGDAAVSKSSVKIAKALGIVNAGAIGGMGKALAEELNQLDDKELATVIRFASKPALDALFKHPQFKIMVGENAGSDVFQTAMAGRINQFPDLGQTLFSGLESRSFAPLAPVPLGDPSDSQNNAISELFERLNSNIQEGIIGALSPKEASAFFKLSADGKGLNDTFSDAEASILVAIAKTNPESLASIFDETTNERMQTSFKDGDLSLKNKIAQTVKLLSPDSFKVLFPQNTLTPVTADELSKKQLDDQFKQMLKDKNPVGYMTAVLRDVKAAPSEIITKLCKAYDIKDPSNKSQVIDGLKDLGRAGNLNPELMAQLMNEMSKENVTGSTDRNRLIDSMSLLNNSAASTDQSLESLKELMVGAMFSHNSLNFVSNQQRMPQTIHTYFEKFSNRMVGLSSTGISAPKAPVEDGVVETSNSFSEDFTTSFCKGLSDFDKRSFLGLIGGISTTHLTQLSDLTPLKNSIAGFVFKNPTCIDGFKTFLGQLFSDGSNPIANEIFKGEFSSQLTMITNISTLCNGEVVGPNLVSSISIGDLAKFDPQSIPPSKDNFIKLQQAVKNIENMLTNQPLTHKQTRSLKALKVMLGARAVVIGNQTGNSEDATTLVQSMQTSSNRYKYHTEYVGRKPIKDAATFMKDQLEFVQLEFNDTSSQVMDDVLDHCNDYTLLSYLGNSILEGGSKATTSTMNLFNSLAYFDIAGDAFKKSYLEMFEGPWNEVLDVAKSIFADSRPVKESAVDYPKAPLEDIANRISNCASLGLKCLTALVALPYASIKVVSTLGIVVTSTIGLPGNITGWSGWNLGNMIIRPVIGLAALTATGLTLFAGGVLASPGLAIQSLLPNEKPDPFGDLKADLDSSMAVNVDSYVKHESLDISSEQDARLFVSGLANYDVSTLEKNQLPNLLTRLKTIELQFPNCTTPEFDQSLKNVVDQTMKLFDPKGAELKDVFTDSSLKAQQMMIATMDEPQQQTYIRQVSISRLQDLFKSSVSGMVSEEGINESQLQFKSAVEEELILMNNPAEKTEFIKELNQTLFGAAIQNSTTPGQNALHLASFRGLQQALEGDAELAGDPTLTNSLNDNVKSYLLSLKSTQQLPVSDRSFDHMIHFLKSSSQSEATDFFKVLGQKMSPNQFDRLYTRIAKHAQINGNDPSRQMLLKAVSESRQERFQSLSFNQRRKINELSASSKQELSGKISDLVNSSEFTDSEKSQICSELLVQNPRQFKRALVHLNKLAKDAPAAKTSGLKAPVAPDGVTGKSAGQITKQSDVPSLPTRVSGDVPSLPTRVSGERPSFPTQTIDDVTAPIAPQSEADTVSNSALTILTDTLADVMSDSGKKVIFESLKGDLYGNPFSSMVYSSLAVVKMPLNVLLYLPKKITKPILYAALYVAPSGVRQFAQGVSDQLSKIDEKTDQKLSFFRSQLPNQIPSYDSLHFRHFDNNPLKQSLDLVMSHKDVTNKAKSNILSNMNKGLFIKTTCDMSEDRLFELVKSDPKSFDKLLGATLSSRDFFDFNSLRNSPKAKLSRKFDNLVAQLANEGNYDLLAKALVHETPARDITFSDIIDQTMFFPVKELFSKFVDQTGLPALFQSPHKSTSFINAYSEGYRRNPVKQRLFGIVDFHLREDPAQMVEFLEQLHTIGDVGKAASLELLMQFSISRDGNAKLIPHINSPELLAMALNNRSKISSEPRTFFDTNYIIQQFKDKENSGSPNLLKSISALKIAIDNGYISNKELAHIVTELGEDGMTDLIKQNLNLSPTDDGNRLDQSLIALMESAGNDLYDLLPKMMGAYAKRAKNDDVKKSMLSNVLNAIDTAGLKEEVVGAPVAPLEGVVAPFAPTDRDSLTGGEIGKSDPVRLGPELPTRKVGGVPDLPTRIGSDTRPDDPTPTLQDSITGPTAPVLTGSTSGADSKEFMANDLKANIVKHMKVYMPLEETDYIGVTLDYTRDSFDETIDHEFPLAIERYLSRINIDGALSETDRKVKAIYDDLVSMKNPDNSEYKTFFERVSESFLAALFSPLDTLGKGVKYTSDKVSEGVYKVSEGVSFVRAQTPGYQDVTGYLYKAANRAMENKINTVVETIKTPFRLVAYGAVAPVAVASASIDYVKDATTYTIDSFNQANFSKKSDLRGLFKKHGLNPDNVRHLFMDSQNQYKFDQMLNTPIRDVIYKGSVVHKTMKKNIEDVRQKVMTSEFSSFDQFFAEMDLIASKYG